MAGVEDHFVSHFKLLWYVATMKFRVPPADAEEILQHAAISLLAVGTRIEEPRAWLIGAVCNACRHYWRRAARRGEVEGTSIDAIPDPPSEFTVERLERAILIRETLRHLPLKMREVLRMHYLLGMTDTEIAYHYGTTPGYARKLITRSLRLTRDVLDVVRGCPAAEHKSSSLGSDSAREIPTCSDSKMTDGTCLPR